MTRSLLLYGGLLVAGLLCIQPTQAQYIVAGQTAGATYVDLVPDKEIFHGINNSFVIDSLDLDNDGVFDFYFKDNYNPAISYTMLKPLHNNVEVYTTYPKYIRGYTLNPSLIAPLNSNDTIQAITRSPAIWSSRTTWPETTDTRGKEAYCFYLCQLCIRGSGPVYDSGWVNTVDHYVGFRLRRSSTENWSYGWLRATLTRGLTIKDYAMSSKALAQLPARAAGWQLYPVPATNLLMVQAATATTGQLTLSDAQGRVHLHQAFTGTRQQLDLSALAAGLYLVRLETSAGSFAQRITKQ